MTKSWAMGACALVMMMAAPAMAQGTRWQTVAGGDPSGDYVSVERPIHEGALAGARTIERLVRTTGYTTGGTTTIVLSGTEAEEARTIQVHLPYGAELELAQGDAVQVSMSSHRVGLGSVHEVRVMRGASIVVLQTSVARSDGVTITRGAEVAHSGSRRQFAVDVAIAGQHATLRPGQLTSSGPLLLSGNDTIYDGTRPPDLFDARVVTAVRVRPLPPPVGGS
jgi:hypothetical protein